MGGDMEPPMSLVVLGIISGCLCLPFIPLYWILVILNGLKIIALREADVQDTFKEIGSNLLNSFAGPFIMIFYLLIVFIIKIVRPIGEISQTIWTKISRISIPTLWRHTRTIENSEGDAECTPLLKNIYRYERLDGKYQIRLLTIYPGSFDDPLRGEMSTANLIWKPSYDALSYTWADETGDINRSRVIECLKSGSFIQITRNCEAAIKHLRLLNKKRRLWIDAVCINQDSDTERSRQVSLMSRIYVTARHVIAYTGEGTAQTDMLFDWLNGLDPKDLNVPSMKKFQDINEADLGLLSGAARLWNGLGATKVWINEVAAKLEQLWSAARDRCFPPPGGQNLHPKIILSDAQLAELMSEYLSRRWFKRVWVLQEVALPALHKTRVICGSKTATAKRALHLISLLKDHESSRMIRIFALFRQQIEGTTTTRSRLLDVLIETRGRQCADPRDKIYGVLSISRSMDKGKFPQLEADYDVSPQEVYARYSAFFISHHGPGFFLSLIKRPGRLVGLPSWAADWTVPWPNYNAVRGIDFAACTRPALGRDVELGWEREDGLRLLVLRRPRILRGHFTRGRHVDDDDDDDDDGGSKNNNMKIEDVQGLSQDEILIQMYPGLAALLEKTVAQYYRFVRTCPHALTVGGVDALVQTWSRVVVNGQGLEGGRTKVTRQGAKQIEHLTPPEVFKIC